MPSTAPRLHPLPPGDATFTWLDLGHGMRIRRAAWTPETLAVLTPEAVALVTRLHRALAGDRRDLLASRRARQRRVDDGELPQAPDHPEARSDAWRIAAIPDDLRRRRVEITGPVNHRRMVINMLSRNAHGARADTAMLDFEDAMKPSWLNVVAGIHNVIGTARGELTATKNDPTGGPARVYVLDPRDMALPMVRVRGLHLDESNLAVDGEAVAGGLFDLALCFLHSVRPLLARGMTPTYYVPKCEHHVEARWWNRLFILLQRAVGVPVGTLRATFLIETLPAALDMEGILFEIRQHGAGLNVGRWDKIFSDIKVLMAHSDRVTADRATIGMNRPWMHCYAEKLIEVCHRRGAMAIGGMAAFTPGHSPEARQRQAAKVLEDKRFEAALGHDGCWVSHPYFIGTALAAFPFDHQLDRRPAIVPSTSDLLPLACGPRTAAGLRTNLRVSIAYLEGWHRDVGCVAWDGLMEDLATLEISRAQTWQWLRHRIRLDDGDRVDEARIALLLDEELRRIEEGIDAKLEDPDDRVATKARFHRARLEAGRMFEGDRFEPFLATASDPMAAAADHQPPVLRRHHATQRESDS